MAYNMGETGAKFSPPYGDSIDYQVKGFFKDSFSPPYGDGTDKRMFNVTANKFSPPYGDGTKTWRSILVC